MSEPAGKGNLKRSLRASVFIGGTISGQVREEKPNETNKGKYKIIYYQAGHILIVWLHRIPLAGQKETPCLITTH